MRYFAILVFILLSGCQSEEGRKGEHAKDQELKSSEQASDTSYTLQSNGWLKVFTNETGACAPHIEQQYTKYSVVGEKIISTEIHTGEGCFEGLNPESAVVKSFSLDPQRKISRAPDWEIKDIGSTSEIIDSKYVAITEVGCCASSDNTKYYSLKNGKYVGRSDAKPLLLYSDKNESRLVLGESYRATASSVEQEGAVKVYLSNEAGIIDSMVLDSNKTPELKQCEILDIDKIKGQRGRANDTISVDLDCYGNPERKVSFFLKAENRLEVVSIRSSQVSEETTPKPSP